MSLRIDSQALLKALWFFLVSVLLGPFALWFLLNGKRRRRGQASDYLSRLLFLWLAAILVGLVLFFAPLHWAVLAGAYLAGCAATAWAMARPGRAELFRLGRRGAGAASFSETLLAAALGLYPLVYILALLRAIGELASFSIVLPSDVYTTGLLWMLYATPAVLLAAFAAWKAGLQPGLRELIYFHASILVVLGWIMVWERLDQFLLTSLYGEEREPLLFGYRAELAFRSAVKWIFYGSAFGLGAAYLAGAARTFVFAKRALLLGLPSFLLYAHMLFLLGDWNYYLSGLRQKLFDGHRHGPYRLASAALLARVPAAYRGPHALEELAELEYQSGRRERAAELLRELAGRCEGKPYYARIGRRAASSLASLERAGAADAKAAGEAALELPVIKPAAYLDEDWYALLSAVAYLQPGWTDLELKKRLLDLSPTVQLRLPSMDNIPELSPALRQLGIAHSACFLTAGRARAALAAGKVPFVSLHGSWVPVSGYDAGRDGFYYYSYRAPGGSPSWFRNEDVDLFHHKPGDAFGGQRERDRARAFRYTVQKFVPAGELDRHLVDIGGVGLILGDSAFAPEAESQAAYLVELGDLAYQEEDDYARAAARYAEASALHPHPQVLSRILYLKRRYLEVSGDERDYRNLFRDHPPEWMKGFGPPPESERKLVGDILEGKLGSYLLMNWYRSPPPDTAPAKRPELDTGLRIFAKLHALEPEEPLYIDSLATLNWRSGRKAAAESLYARLASLYPFGNEYAAYQLAWARFSQGRVDGLDTLLAACPGFSGEARHLTMQGGLALAEGRLRKARGLLAKSLKLEKGLEATHALLARYHEARGDKEAAGVHRLWSRRAEAGP